MEKAPLRTRFVGLDDTRTADANIETFINDNMVLVEEGLARGID
jgi:hypothetical protein